MDPLWIRIVVVAGCLLGLIGLMVGIAWSLYRTELPRWCDACADDHWPGEPCPRKEAA